MVATNQTLFRQSNFYYALFVVLLIPALLINLGSHNLFVHVDESRRALIALEMILSDNYIVPTLNGEYYYNKPPLYNWIIIASFKLFRSYSALALRFPVILALLFFGVLIYLFVKSAASKRVAWIVTVATLTSGRILFYDSFLGLIDILFSALIFLNFMLFYRFRNSRSYYVLFAGSYLLVAMTYLMKGLPPLVFQFFTVVGWAIFMRRWKLIFHPAHFVGLLFLIVPVASYYWFYLQYNPQSMEVLFATLWEESSKRTATDFGLFETVKNLVLFPLENLYHFAPWTFFILCLLSKKARMAVWQNDFTRYCSIIFALNIIVYWTSPGVHPRYLFMFLPLIFAIAWQGFEASAKGIQRLYQLVFQNIMWVGTALPIILYFVVQREDIRSFEFKLVVTFVGLICMALLYYKVRDQRWISLAIYLLIVRICFDWIILPNRNTGGKEYTLAAEEVATITGDEPLYLSHPGYLHDGSSFIISRARNEILRVDTNSLPNTYYILLEREYDESTQQNILKFKSGDSGLSFYLVKSGID